MNQRHSAANINQGDKSGDVYIFLSYKKRCTKKFPCDMRVTSDVVKSGSFAAYLVFSPCHLKNNLMRNEENKTTHENRF